MIRLEITGEDTAEFHRNVIQTLAAIAGMRPKPAAEAPMTPEEKERFDLLKRDAEARQRGENLDGSARRETVTVDAIVENAKQEPDPFPASDDVSEAPTKPEPKRRGRPVKTVEPEASPAEEPAKNEITLETIRDRVRDAIKVFDKKSIDPAEQIKTMRELFAELGSPKGAKELPVDKYAEFMTRSEAWLAE